MLLSLVILAGIISSKHKNVKGLLIITAHGIITHKEANRHRKVMPFKKKFPNSGNTKHIRIPECYAQLFIELALVMDTKFEKDVKKGERILRRFIHNLS
tara:strand:+ start:714 stop:1010 length:297 start_codon:yes stop_codon:yes gene_type:complete